MSCCAPRATGPDTPAQNVSIENIGGGAELYVDFSGPDPFLLRTLVSNGTIIVTQETQTIRLDVNLALANEGGFAEVFDDNASTPTSKLFRTLQSADNSISVVQNADNINLQVTTPATTFESYYSAKTDIVSTNNTTYVTVSEMASVASGAPGEVWIFVCSCLVCHPSGLTTVNTRIRWQIETSTNVWADLEANMNTNEPQTIAVGQRSSPRTRTYQATLNMIAPRLRLQVSMSAAVATGGQLEYAQVSGYKR